jgi:hypothetical protein
MALSSRGDDVLLHRSLALTNILTQVCLSELHLNLRERLFAVVAKQASRND